MRPAAKHEEKLRSKDCSSRIYPVNNAKKPVNVHFNNILVATDFSSTTRATVPYAVEIARRFGATIHVAHVIQPDIYPLLPPSEWPILAKEEEQCRQTGTCRLEEELRGLPHEFLFPKGNIWQNLSRIIEEKNIDLLVLGTHGWTGITKILMGSIAEKIFRRVDCPVLTVGPAVISRASHEASAQLNRILYATDFSPESLAAARFAISLAKEHRAQLILMHAVQSAEPEQADSALHTLRDVIPLGSEFLSSPRYLVERGEPASAILNAAVKYEADIIVLGGRKSMSPIATAARFGRSIVYNVITKAECPVFTVRS